MQRFPSKIILFGEYAVLSGSKLLAIPFNKFSGSLFIPSNSKLSPQQKESNKNLNDLCSYIAKLRIEFDLNINEFEKDIDKGLYFDSNIPQAYGLGSSGALVAAIFHHYAYSRDFFLNNQPFSESILKTRLAQIESYFHENSSGSDPLVSYLNRPVIINGVAINELLHPKGLTVFLIDTKQQGKTDYLVKQYQNKTKSKKNEFITATNLIIGSYLSSDPGIFEYLQNYSIIEKRILTEMFTNVEGLEFIEREFEKYLVTKLCGSGGGGYLLAFCLNEKFKLIKENFQKQNIPITVL